MKTKQIEVEGSRVRGKECFGIADEKGRMIGAIIETWEVDFVPSDDPMRGYSTVEPGRYLAFEPHATRNGNHYGAGQRSQLFKTVAERDAAIAKYLNGARKRAQKNSASAVRLREIQK